MSQTSLPVSDISNSTWTPTPLYSELNEPTPDDGTYVTSSGSSSGDSFVVELAPVAVPGPGTWTLRVRSMRVSGGGSPAEVKVALWQRLLGGEVRLIAQTSFTPSTSFAEVDLVLAQSEVEQIVFDADGFATDLWVEVRTLVPVSMTCCPEPHTYLYVTLSGVSGSVKLMQDGTYWSGNKYVGCGMLYLRWPTDCGLFYKCDDEDWRPAACLDPCITCGPPFSAGLYSLGYGGSESCLGCEATNLSATVSE